MPSTPAGSSDADVDALTIYVQNVGPSPPSTSGVKAHEQELMTLFSAFGECTSATIIHPGPAIDNSYALVKMGSQEAVAAVLMVGTASFDSNFGGSRLLQMGRWDSKAFARHQPQGADEDTNDSAVLHVRGIGRHKEGVRKHEAELVRLFSQFGECVAATVRSRYDPIYFKDTSYALITMGTMEAVEAALLPRKVLAGPHELTVNRYDPKIAAASKGAMAVVYAEQVSREQAEGSTAQPYLNRDEVLAAVSQASGSGSEILHILEQTGWSAELLADKEVVQALAAVYGGVLNFAAKELRADKAFVLAIVAQDGRALKHATLQLRADKEVVQAAVAQNGFALQYAQPLLRNLKPIVIEAVQQSGEALQYASATLRANKEVVLAAIRQDGYALSYASAKLRTDKDVIRAVSSRRRRTRASTAAAHTQAARAHETAGDQTESQEQQQEQQQWRRQQVTQSPSTFALLDGVRSEVVARDAAVAAAAAQKDAAARAETIHFQLPSTVQCTYAQLCRSYEE